MELSPQVRSRIKRLLPKSVMFLFRYATLRSAYRHDRRRYMRYSSSLQPESSRENLAAWITMLYHNIEKGLSLPAPRPGFGREAVGRLVDYLDRYITGFGHDEISAYALGALDGYVRFNQRSGLTMEEIPEYDRVSALLSSSRDVRGGTKKIAREDFVRPSRDVSLDFFSGRSSVRQFDDRPVDQEHYEFAARAAQKTPAVCNRQFSRIYVTTDREAIAKALTIQGGARGFAESVPALAVITTSTRAYWNAGERMQPWTDGGMFAMSFVLGLHARGLGSVCLNWSKTAKDDEVFQSAFAIQADEVIVMLVAFGHVPDNFEVALSPRIPLHQTLRVLKPHDHGATGGS